MERGIRGTNLHREALEKFFPPRPLDFCASHRFCASQQGLLSLVDDNIVLMELVQNLKNQMNKGGSVQS